MNSSCATSRQQVLRETKLSSTKLPFEEKCIQNSTCVEEIEYKRAVVAWFSSQMASSNNTFCNKSQ
jgi:hypothetical protein